MIPALLFSAYSGTGKTTFLRDLIPLFVKNGIKTGYIKHHHGNYFKNKTKNTAIIRKSGIERSLLVAEDVVVIEDPPNLACIDPIKFYTERYFKGYHLVIIEGFKHDTHYPKIVVVRPSENDPDEKERLLLMDPNVIAAVSDKPVPAHCPVFRFKEKEKLFNYLIIKLKLGKVK